MVANPSNAEIVRLSSDGTSQLHPANQIWGYLQMLRGYAPMLRDEKLCSIVNLHNAPAHPVHALQPRAAPADGQSIGLRGEANPT
ncbi:hypothetical protein GCM10018953_18060 [Streptosporangium nondiastaticum]